MSFGYSVGDFIAGANLTYRLIRTLSTSQGASIEYQEAMVELGAIQQALLQVSQMRVNSIFSQATINAAQHIVISSLKIIEQFIERSQKYQTRLSGGDSWCKIGWALFKKEELRSLRDSLHVKMMAVNLVLSSASFHGSMSSKVAQYQVHSGARRPSLNDPEGLDSTSIKSQNTLVQEPIASASTSSVNPDNNIPETPKSAEQGPSIQASPDQVPNTNSHPHGKIGTSMAMAPNVSRPLDSQSLPFTNMSLAEKYNRSEPLIFAQDRAASIEGQAKELKNMPEERKKPIKFKDAVGRKFTFPFHLCSTWAGMEKLICQAFLHVEIIGPHVNEGRYDLVSPNGVIILPQIWESVVEPDWTITMHMWPMPEVPSSSKEELSNNPSSDINEPKKKTGKKFKRGWNKGDSVKSIGLSKVEV